MTMLDASSDAVTALAPLDLADAIGLRAAMDADREPEIVSDPVDPMEELRARLAARGLVRTQPSIVVPKEGANTAATALRAESTTTPQGERAEQAEPATTATPRAIPVDDTWDVEPGGAEVPVRCPQCRDTIHVPLESTRLRCRPCDRAWRWAICGGCDSVTLTVERQESWRCRGCGQFTRSWWRTTSARRDAGEVIARRKHEAVQQEKALIRAGMRKRRRKLVAFALTSTALTVGAILAVRAAEPTTITGTDTVCAHVAQLGPDLGTNLAQQLPALEAEAVGASPEVAKAVANLRAAGAPGTSGFLVARTALADACVHALDGRQPRG